MVRQPYQNALWSARRLLNPSHVVVLYTDLLFQLPPTLTISSATQVRGSDSIGYEICGYAAKDHLKINEGEVKETASWCHWRKPHRHNLWGYRLAG